jgi:hypothetical protein
MSGAKIIRGLTEAQAQARITELTELVANMEAAAKALLQAARPHINNDVVLTRAYHDMRKAMPIRLVAS